MHYSWLSHASRGEHPGGRHFRYVRNNPVSLIDPRGTGMEEIDAAIEYFEMMVKKWEEWLPTQAPRGAVVEGMASEVVVNKSVAARFWEYKWELSRLKSIKRLYGPAQFAILCYYLSGVDSRANETGRTMVDQFHEEQQAPKDDFIKGVKDSFVDPLTDFFRGTFGSLFVR